MAVFTLLVRLVHWSPADSNITALSAIFLSLLCGSCFHWLLIMCFIVHLGQCFLMEYQTHSSFGNKDRLKHLIYGQLFLSFLLLAHCFVNQRDGISSSFDTQVTPQLLSLPILFRRLSLTENTGEYSWQSRPKANIVRDVLVIRTNQEKYHVKVGKVRWKQITNSV